MAHSAPGDECLFVLLMPLPKSPESPGSMQRISVSRRASGPGLFYCIVNLMVWKCLAKKSCSCHSGEPEQSHRYKPAVRCFLTGLQVK